MEKPLAITAKEGGNTEILDNHGKPEAEIENRDTWGK
jgi:hypothetical protein